MNRSDRRVRGRTFIARHLRSGPTLLTGALLLSGAGNMLFTLLAYRGGGASAYGAVAAVLGILSLATLPLVGIQVLASRHVATTKGSLSLVPALRRAAAGAACAAAAAVFVAPALRSFLHLQSPLAVFLVGLTLVPISMSLVLRGVLLGRARYAPVAVADLAGTVMKLLFIAAGLSAFAARGAMAAVLAGELLTTALLWTAAREHHDPAGHVLRVSWADTRGTALTMAGFWALASGDVILARHYLDPSTAGTYAASAMVARPTMFALIAVATAMSARMVLPNENEARQAFERGLQRGLIVAGVVGLMAALAGPTVMTRLNPSATQPSHAVVAAVVVAALALGTANLLLVYRLCRGRILLVQPWVGVMVLVALIAIRHDGGWAIAAGTALAALTVCFVLLPSRRTAPLADRTERVALTELPLWADRAGSLDVSIVVPFYNPGAALRRTVFRLIEVFSSLGVTFEIVTVADGCTDQSETTITNLDPDLVRHVVMAENTGKGHALRAGMSICRGRYVGFIDADGDLDPQLWRPFIQLMRIYEPDMVIGSKRHPLSQVHYPLTRRVCSFGMQQLARLLFRVPARDTQVGIKLIRRDVLAEVLPRLVEDRFAFDLELLAVAARLGHRRMFEAPIVLCHQFRSTVSPRDVVRTFKDVIAIARRLHAEHAYDVFPATVACTDATAEFRVEASTSPPRPRILVCNWRDAAHPLSGGAEVYTHELLQIWHARGYDVTLFSASVAGRPTVEAMNGVRVVRGGSRFTVYRAARRYHMRNRGRFDLIVDEVNTRPFRAPAWPGNVPVVAFIHQLAAEVWEQELPRPIALVGRHVLEPWWLRRYRNVRIVTVSESSKDSLEAIGMRDVAVVPVGLSSPRQRPPLPRADQPTLLFVGRLTPSKRPQDAIAAHRRLRERVSDARLWIVGSGPMEGALRAMVDDGVEFFGRVDQHEKHDLMARAHALVVTSTREGWGMVVDEAAAMGTPSIGYDVAGLRDSIPAARGALVPPDPAALADAVERMLPDLVAHPSLTGWRGGALRWEDVADRFEAIVMRELGADQTARLRARVGSPAFDLVDRAVLGVRS